VKKTAKTKRKPEKKHRSYRRDAADERAISVLAASLKRDNPDARPDLIDIMRGVIYEAKDRFEGPDVELKRLFGNKLKLKQVKSIAYDLELIAYFATVWSVYANMIVVNKHLKEHAAYVALKAGLSLWKNLLGHDFDVRDQSAEDRLRAAMSHKALRAVLSR
jgi:hypothetical protein